MPDFFVPGIICFLKHFFTGEAYKVIVFRNPLPVLFRIGGGEAKPEFGGFLLYGCSVSVREAAAFDWLKPDHDGQSQIFLPDGNFVYLPFVCLPFV